MKKPKRSSIEADKRQLAALATLMGLMQTASKISRELDELASGIGGSIEDLADTAKVPFFEVYNSYRERPAKKARAKRKAPAKKRKGAVD